MKKLLLLWFSLAASFALGQTSTITGTIKDLTGALVTSGQITFTLRPSADVTLSGIARFSSQTITCLISGTGHVVAADGVSSCTITMNTSMQPQGSGYQVVFSPYFVQTASIYMYALSSSIDISTVISTPSELPSQGGFVDTFSTQTITGSKTFTSPIILGQGTQIASAQIPIDPRSFGAKCDGVTDDTAAVQAAINFAFRNVSGDGYALAFPSNNPCVVSQLDLTNINNRIHIMGQASISGFQSLIQCIENTSNTKVCVDFTGSQYISMEHIVINGGLAAGNAPRVTVLLAKSVTGNSQIIHWDDVTVEGFGDYQVYNAGGEVWTCPYCTFLQQGAGGVDLVRLSSNNTAGITSPFTTMQTPPISMSKVNLWGTWSAGGTADAIDIDSSGVAIASITIGGFGNIVSAPYFIRDNTAVGQIHGVTLRDLRVEAFCTACGLASFTNTVFDFVSDNVQWSAPGVVSVPELVFAGQLNVADIVLSPSDAQGNFPNPVVSCSGGGYGVRIHDYAAFGGGAQGNSCPGAREDFNGTTMGAPTGGDKGVGTMNVTGGYYINGAKVVIPASFTTTAATTDNVAVTGMTASGHCSVQATNSGAAGGLASVFVSNKTTNQITVTHTATAGWTFDVLCTPN